MPRARGNTFLRGAPASQFTPYRLSAQPRCNSAAPGLGFPHLVVRSSPGYPNAHPQWGTRAEALPNASRGSCTTKRVRESTAKGKEIAVAFGVARQRNSTLSRCDFSLAPCYRALVRLANGIKHATTSRRPPRSRCIVACLLFPPRQTPAGNWFCLRWGAGFFLVRRPVHGSMPAPIR